MGYAGPMSSRDSLFVVPGGGGWAYAHVPGFPGRLYVRVALARVPETKEPDLFVPRAALKVVDMLIDGEGHPIGAPFLRELPLGAIETLLNEPTIYGLMIGRLDEVAEHYDVATALSHFQIKVAGSAPSKAPRPSRSSSRQSTRPHLSRPEHRALDDAFLQRLSEFYVYAVANGERPLVAIEKEAGVPRNTAARWVALARRKGFLATDPSVRESRKETHGRRSTQQAK